MDCFPLLQTNGMFIADITKFYLRLMCFETWKGIQIGTAGEGGGAEGDLQLLL